MDLTRFFHDHPKAAIALSGGVDSVYLLWAALQHGAQMCAYYVKSNFQPQFELEDARRLSAQLNAPLRILTADILSYDAIAANPPDRCYHCKRVLFQTISQAAQADGFSLLLDGTNASDQEENRPGMRALRELAIRSPLRECGLTKEEIRMRAREAGLFVWDKPAYACLATRIPTGEAITAEKLIATEAAEDYLFSLGFSDFRVRRVDGGAKLQVPENQLPKVLEHRAEILARLKQYYPTVTLDLEVRG